MNHVAAIFNSLVLYRHSLILALAAAAGICFFMACCSYVQITSLRASASALTAVILSIFFARLVYWYGRPDSFKSFSQLFTSPMSEAYALSGVMVGCTLAALLWGGRDHRKTLLDCMSVAGCASLALGRLSSFFTAADRGQIMHHFTGLPWAYPVANFSGQLEYRFAVFLFQAAAAAVLGLFLAVIFLRKKVPQGDVALLFLLFYSASQILLDSTRYDSLYLRSNGFVSMVQVLAGAALVSVIVLLSIRTVKKLGIKGWMILFWFFLCTLFGGVGYMEYYVQRHGSQAILAYSAMGIYLCTIAAIGLLFWYLSQSHEA